jgi:hypothetical protein
LSPLWFVGQAARLCPSAEGYALFGDTYPPIENNASRRSWGSNGLFHPAVQPAMRIHRVAGFWSTKYKRHPLKLDIKSTTQINTYEEKLRSCDRKSGGLAITNTALPENQSKERRTHQFLTKAETLWRFGGFILPRFVGFTA